ncbi:coiled-coil domain-containing protein 40-like [Biomphalaria glabrata]|uniref:Coiled-coil domain-containing protein 40-like n=1 Tax=Biomphalaria glabrata TaxID=6526 RepID=A0A9W2ZI47_BIOGL|nr:coiled-coil domain-containing protein 40-like [Biomphalaria glabrata]
MSDDNGFPRDEDEDDAKDEDQDNATEEIFKSSRDVNRPESGTATPPAKHTKRLSFSGSTSSSPRGHQPEQMWNILKDVKRATTELVKRSKSRLLNREELQSIQQPQQLRWGSDTALPMDKEELNKSSSDQDLEGTLKQGLESEPEPIPLTGGKQLKKTASIMNVSRMNFLEDYSPKERLMASLLESNDPFLEMNKWRTSQGSINESGGTGALRKSVDLDDEADGAGGGGGGGGSGGGGGGSGGGGGGGHGSVGGDDVDSYGEDAGLETDESDTEADMVVLDPDHPLMKRFQAALKAHLDKQNEKITLELRDLSEKLRVKKKSREDLGVELYGVQQELAKYQMMLEQQHDQVASLKQERQKEEQELNDVRFLFKDTQLEINKERKNCTALQNEVENLALRLFYMTNSKENVRSDISVMKRAAEKVETEVARAELLKQKQDLYVDRLVEGVERLKEEIAMYDAQISAQTEETKAAKESLMEAYMDIESVEFEKKDLFQKWNSSLIGMKRRDEAHSAMLSALNQQEQLILTLQTDLEGYKKTILKEQEQNEKLTHILNKTEREIESAKKQMTQIQTKHEALMNEFNTYSRMLYETEQALGRAVADKQLRIAEVLSLRKQIEQEHQSKNKLEDEILERMRAQLTLAKASHYSKQLIKKTRDVTKRLESETIDVENNIAQCTLDIVNVRGRTERLRKVLDVLENQIAEQNAIITKSEQEMLKRNAVIERKQNQVDSMNKRLTQMIAAAGGVELGPLEIQVNSLHKSIEAKNQEVLDLQQLWLRQQSELVRLCQKKDKELVELVALRRQLTILSQKKVRTEAEIEQQHREMCEIERSVRNMRNDIIKLNDLLHKEKCAGEELEQGNILMENAFIAGLQDAELESIQLQAKLDEIKDEKERLLNSLVEAERQIMLWEKKTQLARETRDAVNSEIGQGEMQAMRSEIHRMQVRHSQLMKQQEKMIQDMEKAVSRRDTIVTRGEAQSKLKDRIVTKGTFERQMGEMRKKIKQTIQEANGCDTEMKELREHQQTISEQLEQKQVNCQQLQGALDTMDGDIERALEVKQRNMSELLSRQQKSKYYQQLKDNKYTMMCRSESALEMESQKQEDRLQSLTSIVHRLNSEFPYAQPALRKVTMTLATRSSPLEA